jgi:TP901 family phage tail tape measure protein
MSNIQLKITGTGDFSSITQQLKALQIQIDGINKSIVGVGVNAKLKTQLTDIQNQFKSSMLSAGNFTAQTVQLTSETEKFGKALEKGKLSLGQYFGIITGRSAEAKKSVEALAVQQVKLNNSIVQADITKQGVYTVYTPTTINKVAKATEIAAAKQNIFNLAVREGSNQLINFGKNTQWAGRQLTVGLSVPVMLFGSQAMKVFQDVNTELVRMQKVYGTGLTAPSQTALDTIKKQVTGLSQELAKTMGIAAKDTAAMAADLAATGKTGNDLLVATREAMRLSKLGELDTQAAMKATISLQNVYKLSTQDLSGAVDFLNAVENQTSTSLQDLVDGIPRVGPIVQQLGGSFKDTAVMMVAMKEAGVPAAQSANAIKSAIASLINPTKAAKEAFAQYNINLGNIATSTKGNPVKMIMQLQDALKGLAPLAQAQLIEKLFGKFQEARIQALITNLGAVNSQTKTAFDLVNATAPQLAAVAANEMKIATESTTGKFKRAIETLKADLIPVGQKIMEVATSIMNFGAKIASFFNGLPGPIKTGLGVLLTLGAIAGPVIMITGLFANLMGQVMKVGYSLLGVINGSKKWKDLMTPAGVAARTATDLFNEGLMNNVLAVDNLNAALRTLIVNLESVNAVSTVGTIEGIVLKAESKLLLPGMPGFGKKMASGGIVPGVGNRDTFPAMLTPGESVIPKASTEKYGSLIQSMINGTLPGFSQGAYKVKNVNGRWVRTTDNDAEGQTVTAEMLHAQPLEDRNLLQTARDAMHLQTTKSGTRALDTVNDVEPSLLVPSTNRLNQLTRSTGPGITGLEAASELEKGIAAGIDPISHMKVVMEKMNIPLQEIESTHAPALRSNFIGLIEELKTTKAKMRFGTNPNMTINPGETAGGSFESQMYGAVSGTLGDITATGGRTGKRFSLRDVYSRILGTRGPSLRRNKPGALANTGLPLAVEEDLSLSSFNNSEIKKEFPKLTASTFSTSGGHNLPGIVTSKKAGEDLGQAVDEGFRSPAGTNSNSDSKKAVKSAEYYTDGIKTGLKKGKAGVEKEAANIGDTVDKTVQGRFSKAFGSSSRFQGMMGKMKGMGPMGNIGLSMGATMLTQMAAPLIQKLPGGDVVSGAMQGASMGMSFGPWGAAAGAAIGLVSGSIGKLIASEHAHAAAVKASFTASADVITMFGGSMQDVTQQTYLFTKAVDQSQKSFDVIKNNVEAINKMPANSPLRSIGESLKGMNTGSSVIGTVKQFAASQVAAGMDPSKVKEMVDTLLTFAGQTKYLTQAEKEVTAGTKDLTTATKTWLTKLNDAKQGSIEVGTKYNDLNAGQKRYADGLLQITNSISSSSTPIDTMLAQIKSLGSNSINTSDSIAALSSALTNAGQAAAGSNVSSWGGMGMNMPEVSWLLKMSAAGMNTDVPKPLQNTKENIEQYVLKPGITKLLTDQAKTQVDSAKASLATLNNQNKITALQNSGDSAQIKALQLKKNLLDAQLKVMQRQTSELKAQQQFQLGQSDLNNQIRIAQASGDFLKASLLQQQKSANAVDYASQSKLSAMQNQSADLGEQIAALKAAAQALKDKAVTKIETAQNASAIAAANKLVADAQKAQKNIPEEIKTILGALNIGEGLIKASEISPMHVKVDPYSQASGGGQIKPATGKTLKEARDQAMSGGNGLQATITITVPGGHAKSYDVFSWKGNDYATDTTSGQTYSYDSKAGTIGKKAIKLATGGRILGAGSATSDSIPAYLSNGEYVVKADSVKHYGTGFFDSVNAKKFSSGGQVFSDILGSGVLKNLFSKSANVALSSSDNVAAAIFANSNKNSSNSNNKKSIWDDLSTGPKWLWNIVKTIPGGIINNIDMMSAMLAGADSGKIDPFTKYNRKAIAKTKSKDYVKTGLINTAELGSNFIPWEKGAIPLKMAYSEIASKIGKKAITSAGYSIGGKVKLPSFASGINNVPYDMIAQIHKGERITPASQNNGTMGSTYNITVNAGSNASADDIAKTVINTLKRQNNMISSNRSVRV